MAHGTANSVHCMRVGVTGGRDYDNHHAVVNALSCLPPDAILVHGDATGADTLCVEQWGDIHERDTEAHPADWLRHGKAAGPIRNQQMIDSGLDLLIAFPGGRGTADMTRRARAAGVPVVFAETGDR